MKPAFIFPVVLLFLLACAPPAVPAATQAPTATQEPSPLPLSGLGSHLVGWKRMIEFVDTSRNDRKGYLAI